MSSTIDFKDLPITTETRGHGGRPLLTSAADAAAARKRVMEVRVSTLHLLRPKWLALLGLIRQRSEAKRELEQEVVFVQRVEEQLCAYVCCASCCVFFFLYPISVPHIGPHSPEPVFLATNDGLVHVAAAIPRVDTEKAARRAAY